MAVDARQGLKRVTFDGLAYGVMVGLGEPKVAAFALVHRFGDMTAGLVAALPVLAWPAGGCYPKILRSRHPGFPASAHLFNSKH